MNQVNATITIPFDITIGFRKRVANTLNIGVGDLPQNDVDFIEFVMNHCIVDIKMQDTITEEEVDLTCFISTEPLYGPHNELPSESIYPILDPSVMMQLPVVDTEDNKE